MLSSISQDWNETFKGHLSRISKSSVSVHEDDKSAHFNDLTIRLNDAMEIPSRDFNSFDHWSCFTKKNCDGMFLVSVSEGVFDLVAVELKSAFDTDELYKAKEQIMISIQKSRILLDSLASFSIVKIRRIYGIVVSLSPDDGDLAWIKGQSELSREEWGAYTVGLSFVIDGYYKAKRPINRLCERVCPPEVDIFYYGSKASSIEIDLPL